MKLQLAFLMMFARAAFCATPDSEVTKALDSLKGAGVCDYLSATVVHDTAILQGYVTDRSLVHEAVTAVSRVPGILSVVDHVRLLASDSQARRVCRDEYKALREEDRLRPFLDGPHPRLHIVAHDGEIELFGSVNTESESALASVYALDVPDSGPVYNHIRVLHPVAREEEKVQ